MTAKSITSTQFSGGITASPRRTGLTAVFFKIAKPLFLLLLLPGLLLSAARATSVPGATITLNSGQLTNVFSSDDFTVTFTTAQTGLTASNFTVTGTVTGAFVSNVTGSGTSWTVTVTIPGSFQSQGFFTLNLANSTNLSPGLSGLPIAAPTVGVIAYPLDGTFSLSSSNANSGYAKTGDKINFTLQSAHYQVEFWGVNVAGQNASGGPNFSFVATGQVTLGSGTAEGPLAWDWHYTNNFNENNSGSGTSGIIFDSVNPTISVGAPSANSTGTGPVTYNVTYADANFNTSTLSTSNITLNTTGTATGTIGLTENSSSNYTVTISNITGAGTLGISIGAGTASDMAGNLAPASSASTTFNVVPASPTTTSISSNNNPSFSATPGNSVTFTATVTSFGSPVTSGTVSFTSNGTAIVNGANVALNGSGQAAVTTSFATAGAYNIMATYNGTSNFSSSSGSLTQQVNLHPTTINSITANSAYSNAGTIQFTVTFGASVSGLSTGNFSLATTGSISGATVASVSPSSGSTYTVTVNTGTGDGTIGLNFSDASGISPAISTSLPFTGATSIVDKTAPTVLSVAASSRNPTNQSEVSYTVTFSEDVTGVNQNAFSFDGGNNNNDIIRNVSVNQVSASVYNVVVDFFAGASAFVQMRLSNGGGISDLAGNILSNTLDGDTFTIDVDNPDVNSITAVTPGNANPTNATSVTYAVSFSEAVTNVNANSFAVTKSGGVNITGISVSQADDADYYVTVSGISGNGTLRLDAISGGGISDLSGNGFQDDFTNGDVYTIDTKPPVTTLMDYGPDPDVNSVGTVLTVTVRFSEKVQTPVITIGGHLATVRNTSGNTWAGSYQLTAGDAEGDYYFDVKATDVAGNTSEYNSGSDNALITFDKTPPVPVMGNPSANATQGGPVTYSVDYNDANLGLVTIGKSDISLNTTGSATADINVDNNGISATVTLYNIAGDGTLGISIGPNTAIDQANNFANSAGPSTTFIVDNTPPMASISTPSVTSIGNNGTGTVTYTITYADANFSTSNLTNAGITLNNPTGTATGTIGVTGSGTTYTVTISNITGLGTLGISLGAGYASDLAGNTDAGAGASATFNVVSSDATLASLGLSSGTLSPTFSPGGTSYTAAVPNSVSSITVTASANDGGASVTTTVNGAPASGSAPLNVGSNAISVVVTAADGTTKTYTVTVTRGQSINSYLAAINPSVGHVSPAFTQTNTAYTLSVSNAIASITVKPVCTDAGATLKVNGSPLTSGTVSNAIALAEGTQTPVTIVVRAANGSTRTYTLTVTRAPSADAKLSSIQPGAGALKPAFVPPTISYTDAVPNISTSTTITPTAEDANATITVNGSPATSGSPFTLNNLVVGTNTATILVTAQDGSTKKTYTVTVTRAPSINAYLASLNSSIKPLSPIFVQGTYSYALEASNTTAAMTIAPVTAESNATMTINTAPATSGTTFGPIALSQGQNIITVVVTAQDGVSKKTYTITVTRDAPGGDNNVYQPVSVEKPITTPTLTDEGILVHQGLSPNGDGQNDFLQIDNISQYPENKLSIMNRNGQLIYEAKGYDNTTKAFDGHSNKNGQMQLPGTYFYQLEYTVNGTTKHKTGFIVLKY